MNLDELIQLDESRINKTAVLQQIGHNLVQHQLARPVDFPGFKLELDS